MNIGAVLKPLTRLMLTAEMHKHFTNCAYKTFIFMLKNMNGLATNCFYFVLITARNGNIWIFRIVRPHEIFCMIYIYDTVHYIFLNLIKQFNGKWQEYWNGLCCILS
jgi:hypothetical protein